MTVTINGTGSISGLSNVGGIASAQSGSVIQTVTATYSTQTTTTSTSPVTTGFSASITPQFSTSKILVIASCATGVVVNSNAVTIQVWRGGSSIFQMSSTAGYIGIGTTVSQLNSQLTQTYLDSPATTSSTTYTIYFASFSTGTGYFCINSNPSTITLMEIAA
jgi:hypothetical protein